MPRVEVFWHVLFLLWRHFGRVRLTRNTPGTEQRSCYIVFTQTRLSIVELTIAPVTRCHLDSPANELFKTHRRRPVETGGTRTQCCSGHPAIRGRCPQAE